MGNVKGVGKMTKKKELPVKEAREMLFDHFWFRAVDNHGVVDREVLDSQASWKYDSGLMDLDGYPTEMVDAFMRQHNKTLAEMYLAMGGESSIITEAALTGKSVITGR